MSYKPASADRDWEVVEIVRRGRGACASEWYQDELEQTLEGAIDDDVMDMLGQVRLLIAAGDPPNSERGRPTIQKVATHEFRHEKKRVRVKLMVLKGKPGHWRTYFIVPDHAACVAVCLYTVAKKTDSRDPTDVKHCTNLIERFYAGDFATRPLNVPSR